MKRIIIFMSVLLCALTAHNQAFLPQTSGVSSTLNSIDFSNDNVGMAVSHSGEILNTTNGGTTWELQNSGVTTTLRDVVMINPTTAIAIGYNGLVLRTTNGGTTWGAIPSGTSEHLVSIVYTGSLLYVVGANGKVLKSTNMGATWTVFNVAPGVDLKAIYFTSSMVGYIAGNFGKVFKTVDGGMSWTQLVSGIETPNNNQQLVGMYFTDANNGFIVGGNMATDQGLILRTTNAGVSWTLQLFSNNYFGTIVFLNNATGFVSGGSVSANSSKILKTNDGGNTWLVQPSSSNRQYGASFPSFNAGYTCGLNGTILKVTDINLGLDDVAASDIKFEVYPNPNNGHFTLSLEEEMTNPNTVVEVLNLNGEVVLKQNYQTNMDISDLMNGVYFVRMTNDRFSVTRKIIKE